MRYTADPLIKVGLRPDYSEAFNDLNSAIAGMATTSSSFWDTSNSGIKYQGHIAVGVGTEVDTVGSRLTTLSGQTLSTGINNQHTFTSPSINTSAAVMNVMLVNPSDNTANNFIAQDGFAEVKSGNSTNITGLVLGDGGAVYHSGTGTVGQFYGVLGLNTNYSSGTISIAAPVNAVILHTGSGTITTQYGYGLTPYFLGTDTVTTYKGVNVATPFLTGGSIGTAYGVYISPQSTGTTGISLAVGAGKTNTIWVSSENDPTSASGGIVFGISKDTNLYRGAANRLVTDDTFQAAAYRVGSTDGVSGSFTTVDGKTVTVTSGIITAIV